MSTRGWLLVPLFALSCSANRWLDHREARLAHAVQRQAWTTRTVALGRDRVHVWTAGIDSERHTLVLVHGFGANALWGWHENARAFSRDHAVVAPDLLWFGGSTSDDPTPSIEHQAAAMAALLDRFDRCPCTWVGVSYGGLVAFTVAQTRPDLVDGLVLVDSPGPVYSMQDYAGLLARFSIDHVADLVVPGRPDDVPRLLDASYTRAPSLPPSIRTAVHQRLLADEAGQRRALLQALVESLAEPRSPEVPEHIRTLVIWGEDDPVFPLPIAHRLARAIGSPPPVVIEDARHAPNLEYPRRFERAVLEFVAPLQSGQSGRRRRNSPAPNSTASQSQPPRSP